MTKFDSPLQVPTNPGWVGVVMGDFHRFLQDHAACERKAAALAMSFVAKYADRPALIEPMVSLAREELEHFAQVFRLIQARGLELSGRDEKDLYVNDILACLRHGLDERFLDRLIMSGLVEARGHERFHILGEALLKQEETEELGAFYCQLARREAGHYKIFINIARQYFSESDVQEALGRIATIEAEALSKVPLRPVLH